jgi:GntR family transcriptional regulator
LSSFVPRYYEIEQALRARIDQLEPHDALPSDAELCAEFGVSRMTARNAVQRLVQDGLVYRLPGRGTFVAERPAPRTASHVLSFTEEMRRRGRESSSRVVDRTTRAASADERRQLRVDEVAVLRRVRIADGEPVALEAAVFPASRVGGLLDVDLEHRSLHASLAAAGITPTAGLGALTAEAASAEDARLLGVTRGRPLLVERRLIYDQDGAPLEWTESRYVGDRYSIDVLFEVET